MGIPAFNEVNAYLKTISLAMDEVDGDTLIDSQEVESYRYNHSYRMWRSLQLIEAAAPPNRPLRVLELGSAPYFFSALMLHYLDVEVVGSNVQAQVWPSKSSTIHKAEVTLRHGPQQQTDRLPVYIFNFELDRFPFAEAEFDLVLCMEVIEHLAYAPTHMLAEAHRVLKPGGTLLLTTPNAVDMHKTIRMVRNKPIAFEYSGYGIYGRHNREFTGQELATLTADCGFEVQQVQLENVYRHFEYWPPQQFLYSLLLQLSQLPLSYFVNKREYIFLTATGTGQYRFNYNSNFYHYSQLYDDVQSE
ncbi:MAG: class I SAM-dependent methyltransferase [Anaerolineae bacterium]|nr:class I SAM-dependent methyltransferase [Anaerolineae bacterium]